MTAMNRPSFADYDDEDLVDTTVAAALTGRARHTLENLRSTGGGPRFRQARRGGKVLYRIWDLKLWIADQDRGSTSR